MLRTTFNVVFLVLEKIASELAIVAAILSVFCTGTIYDRILGGMFSIWHTVFNFFWFYIKNTSFADAHAEFSSAVNQTLQLGRTNIEQDPNQVFLAIIATYVAYKVLSYVLRFFRKAVFKKVNEETYQNSKSSTPKEQKVSNQLYGETDIGSQG